MVAMVQAFFANEPKLHQAAAASADRCMNLHHDQRLFQCFQVCPEHISLHNARQYCETVGQTLDISTLSDSTDVFTLIEEFRRRTQGWKELQKIYRAAFASQKTAQQDEGEQWFYNCNTSHLIFVWTRTQPYQNNMPHGSF